MADQDDEGLDWAGYYAYLGDRPLRPLFVRALEEYGDVAPGAVAVDLGCGSGIETRALLGVGFSVTAIDSAPDSMRRLAELPEHGGRLTAVPSAMQDAELPRADLLYAGFALPFCPPPRFDDLWRAIRTAIEPGGLLAVDLFGVRDAWAGEPDLTFVTRERPRLTPLIPTSRLSPERWRPPVARRTCPIPGSRG